MRQRIGIILIMLLAAGCNLSFSPEATPTFAPTRTPTATEPATPTEEPTTIAQLVATATATLTETLTVTPRPTSTPAPTDTITRTPSATPTATDTATATATATDTPTPTDTATATETSTGTPKPTSTATSTPTATLTLTPTNTATPTNTFTPAPTDTPRPTSTIRPTPLPTIGPSATPTPSVTPTSTETRIPTATPRPTETPIPPTVDTRPPTLNATQVALLATDTPRPPTAIPNSVPTRTLIPPTQNVTPTFITAEATAGVLPSFTPIASTPEQNLNGATTTPTPPPTVELIVTLAPTIPANVAAATFLPILPPQIPNPRAFALTGNGAAPLVGLGDDAQLYVQNPVYENVFGWLNDNGRLNFTDVSTGTRTPMTCWPQSANENDSGDLSIDIIAWSPDGNYVAFHTIPNRGDADPNGLFVMNWRSLSSDCSQHEIYYILPDCPSACANGSPQRTTRDIRWSPSGAMIIIEAQPSDIGRRGVFVRSAFDENNGVAPLPYDYGYWTPDGGSVIVSGIGPEGRPVIHQVGLDGSLIQVIMDNGLFVRDAVQRSDGSIVALGAGDPNGAWTLINSSGTPLSQPIGNAPPTRVTWAPARGAVYVATANGRQFIVYLNGTITEITAQVGDALAINWVGGTPVTTNTVSTVPVVATPSGIIEGSQYQPGQQQRYIGQLPLNIRIAPGTNSAVVGVLQPGSYVAILAGPSDVGGITWWQIQTADNIIGWIAGAIGGTSVLGE